jgi:hypothetical protein
LLHFWHFGHSIIRASLQPTRTASSVLKLSDPQI